MGNTKKILLIVSCLSLIYCIVTISDTYAKYKTEASADTSASIARWKILINNQDIKEKNDFSNTIIPVFPGNDNTKEGIIAPTAEGYFDIVVDGSNTDVSYKFKLDLNVSETSAVKDLVITHYTENSQAIKTFDGANYSIEKTVSYDTVNKSNSYRFYIKWDDSENATMDNAADTAATTNGKAKFDVKVSVIQIPKSS